MLLYCTIVVITILMLYRRGTLNAAYSSRTYLAKPSVIAGMAVFSLWVGLRYNVKSDIDFEGYWNIVENGSFDFYYFHLEAIPKLCVDIVNNVGLPTSVWFIMMGAFLAFFTTFAARRFNGKYLFWLFLFFLLLYLTFDMNVIRQGIALSVMLCAFTYISERKWKHYLFFVFLAFCFHRSSVIWAPVYLLTYVNLQKNATKKYLIAFLVTTMVMSSLLYVMTMFSFVFEIMQMEDKLDYRVQGGAINEIIQVGSGLGIVFRYLRWLFICIYLPRIMKFHTNKSELRIFFMIFVFGIAMDPFTMFEVSLSRIPLYPQIVEILLLPYLVEYCKQRKKSYQLLLFMLIIQIAILGYQIGVYFSKWEIVDIML